MLTGVFQFLNIPSRLQFFVNILTEEMQGADDTNVVEDWQEIRDWTKTWISKSSINFNRKIKTRASRQEKQIFLFSLFKKQITYMKQ